MFKDLIKNYLLKIINLKINLNELNQFLVWQNNYNFEEPFPQFVKEKVFNKYNLENSIWIETGTYLGTSTSYFSKISKHVHTIEPSKKYFNISKENLRNIENVSIYNGASEEILSDILNSINDKENVCFWLDGHYSGGNTFKGSADTPILLELKTIANSIKKFNNITILIDDFRLFSEGGNEEYPNKEQIISWVKANNLHWTITRDIFVIY